MVDERIRTVLATHRLLGGDDGREVDLGPLRPIRRTTALPPPAEQLAATLTSALWARSSRVPCPDHPLAGHELSTVLRMAAGPQRAGGAGRMAMAPSAGGLASIDVHLVTQRVGGVPAGVHRYDRATGVLTSTSLGDPATALRSVLVQPDMSTAAAVLVLVGRLDRTLPHYPARHYRQLFADTGVLAQNVYLLCAALDLACCAVAGFHDHALGQLVDVDPRIGLPTLAIAIGVPTDRT
jgi:SagB-type dehydrogenase family enzyme